MSIDVFAYWQDQPPEPSPRLALWVERISSGWKMNQRIRAMGYAERAKLFGVYLWEYFNVLYPMLRDNQESDE